MPASVGTVSLVERALAAVIGGVVAVTLTAKLFFQGRLRSDKLRLSGKKRSKY
jgi:hypothetical protein